MSIVCGLMDVFLCFKSGIPCWAVGSMWLGDGGGCEWLTACNGLSVTYCGGTCTVYPQFMEVWGCISSLVKQSRVVYVYDDSLYVVVGCFMRFVNMWLYPDCVVSDLTNPLLPCHQFKEARKKTLWTDRIGLRASGLAVFGDGRPFLLLVYAGITLTSASPPGKMC
jgi:hypothetical protein